MKIFIKYDYEFDKNLKEPNEVSAIKRIDIYEKIAEEIVLNEFIYKQPCEYKWQFASQPALNNCSRHYSFCGKIPNPKNRKEKSYEKQEYKIKCFS